MHQVMPATPEEDAAQVAALEQAARLDQFGLALAKKRKEAVDGRRMLGIEDEWIEDEEAYDGIDDTNRHEHRSNWTSKPPNSDTRSRGSTRSTVYLPLTRPYCDAAAARIADMLLPTDDKPWGLEPTPIPDLIEAAKVKSDDGSDTPQALEARAILDAAEAQADRAEKRIEDWFAECLWHAEVRQVIEDAARKGTGVIKGPHPVKRRKVKWGGGSALSIMEEIAPASSRVDPWRFYPDPSCGESIHNGNYTWEYDDLTAKQLMDLVGVSGYLPEQVLKCLEEGPQSIELTDSRDNLHRGLPEDKRRFQIWYYHGLVDREDLEAARFEAMTESENQSVCVTMVNNRVIKAAANPLDTGEYPYDVMVWQKRPGMPWGRGVARQIRTPQRMLNAAARNMMDNAALTSGPQIIIRQKVVTPADGNWTLTPRKVWYVAEGADVGEVDHAFRAVNIETQQEELMNIVQFALRMAEEVTGLPMILQGQQGKAPDTVGGMTILQNNASAVLRRIARLFDDSIISPHVRRYYAWLMQHGEDESEKGENVVVAKGSSTLVERDLQNQEMLYMANMVLNPAFGLDPEKYAEEWLKSRRFDPKRFQMDEAQKEAMKSQNDPLTEAKVELLLAQAAKTITEAVNKRVEAMFSATNAAQLVATVPGVATAADEMLLSAGAQDMNAPPLIPEPAATGAPIPDVAKNTNPLTPVNAGVGMKRGIEAPAGGADEMLLSAGAQDMNAPPLIPEPAATGEPIPESIKTFFTPRAASFAEFVPFFFMPVHSCPSSSCRCPIQTYGTHKNRRGRW